MQNSKKILAFMVLAVYGLMFYFFIATLFHLLLFVIGLALGAIFLLADEAWLHRFYRENDDQDWLVTRSPLFIAALIPLTIFVVTSTNSYLTKGFILGTYLYLFLEMAQYRNDPIFFKKRYLEGTNFNLTSQVLKVALGSSFLFFILLNILSIL